MKTIKVFLISILLLLSEFVFAQTDTSKFKNNKWTIGIILLNDPNYGNLPKPYFFPGISVKRHYDLFTIRTGIECITKIDKNNTPLWGTKYFAGSYTNEGIIRIGIEKCFTIKKYFRPYIAFELAGIKSRSEGLYLNYRSEMQRSLVNSIGIAFMPSFGYEFKIKKRYSISFETRFRFLYANEKTSLYDTYSSNNFLISEDIKKRKDLYWNRIGGLTLNIKL